MSFRIKKVVGIGKIQLSKGETEEYKSIIWKDLVYKIGEKIVDSNIKEISSRSCIISFFPKEDDKLENLVTKQNISHLGESLIVPLFYIQYNKDLEAINCIKIENETPTQLTYLILV